MRTLEAVLCIALLAGSGCSRPSSDDPTTQTPESSQVTTQGIPAGDSLIPVTDLSQQATIRSSRSPRMRELTRIDGVAEDLVLIGAVAPRHDGIVAFSQPQDLLVRLYTSAGVFVGTVGGRGDGPGEFTSIARLGWVADTLWVFAGLQRRLTYFAPDLDVLLTTSGLPVGTWGVTQGRSLIVGSALPEEGYSLDRYSPDGSQFQSAITQLPPGDHPQIRHATGTVAVPLGSTRHFAVSRDGERLAVAIPFVEGRESGTFSLALIDSHGATLFAKRFEFQGEEVPDDVWRSTLEERTALAERAGMTAATDILRQIPKPKFFPPIRGISVGNDGTTWIEGRHDSDGVPYRVFDAEGTPVGTIRLPDGDRLGAIVSLEEVWVIEPDELGVEDLVRYQVLWN